MQCAANGLYSSRRVEEADGVDEGEPTETLSAVEGNNPAVIHDVRAKYQVALSNR